MEHIFHEKQEGQLCAQHCLNALLQEKRFTAVDLADLAHSLDAQERRCLMEGTNSAEEVQRILEQPSGNLDDSGYFSIQVIEKALEFCGLELVPYMSNNSIAVVARDNPPDQQAYICNYHNHWYTLRKLGHQWFNLNSTLAGPQLISDTYLAIFLEQIKAEGHSVFVVIGPLPASIADDILKVTPAVPPPPVAAAKAPSKQPFASAGRRLGSAAESGPSGNFDVVTIDDDEDEDLKAALKLSMEAEFEADCEWQLQRALALSKAQAAGGSSSMDNDVPMDLIPTFPAVTVPVSSVPNATENGARPSADQLRQLRSSFLDRFSSPPQKAETPDAAAGDIPEDAPKSDENLASVDGKDAAGEQAK